MSSENYGARIDAADLALRYGRNEADAKSLLQRVMQNAEDAGRDSIADYALAVQLRHTEGR